MQASIFASMSLRFLGVGLSFLLNVYLARNIEKAVLGEYFVLTQVLLVLSILLRRGLDTALLKYAARLPDSDLQKVLAAYVRSTIAPAAIGAVVIASVTYVVFPTASFLAVLFISAALLPVTISNLVSEYLKGRNHPALANALQTCLFPPLVIVYVAAIGSSVFEAYFFAATGTFIITLWAASHVLGRARRAPGIEFKASEFWREARTFMGIAGLNIVMNSMDLIMLGVLSNNSAAAEYGIANRLASICSILLIAVNGVLGPRFSVLWHESRYDETFLLFRKATAIMAGCAVVIFGFIFLVGERLLVLFFGPEFAASASLLTVLTLGQGIVLATGPVAYLLMMTNSRHVHQRSLIAAVSVNLALNLALIPPFGALGAAIATAGGLVVKNAYSFFQLTRIYSVQGASK